MSWFDTGMRRSPALWMLSLVLLHGQPSAMAANRTDFSGMWISAGPEHVKMVEANNPKFTARALVNLAYYQQHFDPATEEPTIVCLLKGMPWTMLLRPRDYPVEIYQTRDRVIMFFELYDTHRNIFLDRNRIAEEAPPSGNGYSIGRWEGRTLVVETGRLTALDPIGPYQRSEQAHVTERWSLRQDATLGETLHVDIRVDDPLVFLEPGRGEMNFKRARAGTQVGGYNCSEALWSDYVQSRRAGIEKQPVDPTSRGSK
jgi:hypothetical protein